MQLFLDVSFDLQSDQAASGSAPDCVAPTSRSLMQTKRHSLVQSKVREEARRATGPLRGLSQNPNAGVHVAAVLLCRLHSKTVTSFQQCIAETIEDSYLRFFARMY